MEDILYVGDTLDFVTKVPEYPATDGYSLKYRLVPRESGVGPPIEFTSVGITDGYRSTVDAAITAGWVAGEYWWRAWVEGHGQKFKLAEGLVILKPDLTVAATYEWRSQAVIALAACKAAYANFSATGGKVKRYSIAGREMEFDTATDIIPLIRFWQVEVAREERAEALRQGLPNPQRIYVRMGNA